MIASLDSPLARGVDIALGDPLAREVELRGMRGIELPRNEGTCGVNASEAVDLCRVGCSKPLSLGYRSIAAVGV